MGGASELEKAIDKLMMREKGWKRYKPAPAVGARPGAVTTGRPSGASSVSGSASAFAEKDYLQREYYAARPLVSSDGIFTIMWQPIKSVLLEDGSRATFREPV